MTYEGGFRVGYVPGVTLTKWLRVWNERHPSRRLLISEIDPTDPTVPLFDGRVDMVFARLPIARRGLSVIPLYDEQPVVIFADGHALEALESVVLDDLAGFARVDLGEGSDADAGAELGLALIVEIVAAGSGIAVMPHSLARLHSRKGVAMRPIADLDPTTIALVWPEEQATDEISDFIGVVRGRTANSSRDRRDPDPEGASRASAKAAPAKAASRVRVTKPRSGGRRGGPSRSRGR